MKSDDTVGPAAEAVVTEDGECGHCRDDQKSNLESNLEGDPDNGAAGDDDARDVGDDDEDDDEGRLALRRECDALFDRCRQRADAAERAQQKMAQDFAKWERKRGWGAGATGPVRICRPPTPLPLRDGLHSPLARMIRKMDTPQGRLLVTVRVAEAVMLPRLAAYGPGDKEKVDALIGYALRLDGAVASGMLAGYTVCWKQTGRWPRRPSSVRLLWHGGKIAGDRLLGEHGPTLDKLIARMCEKTWTHMLNGRPLINPPLPGPPPRW